ncbi:MAG: ATPase, partial [Anaerolineae bacterium]|nr:ATPase [Anaerolineae bacterium]
TVVPPFWQTWWFRSLVGLGVLALVLGFFTVRIRTINAQRQQLQMLVNERTRDLEIAKERALEAQRAAEVASQAKSQFLANMSHELRTPLNGILGYAQIIKQDPNLNRRQKEGLNIIQQSGQHLLTLINDILDLAKIEAGKIELQPTNFQFTNFLEGVAGIVRMRAEEKDILFVYQAQPPLPNVVKADEKQLRQVLLNLLGNAVKFTDSGQVTFRVQALERATAAKDQEAQARIRFDITDTGIGIAPKQLENIFQPFEQVSDMQHRAEGTGLGLAISQRIIGAMGGQIQVESKIGQGSTFWFELNLIFRSREAPLTEEAAMLRGELVAPPQEELASLLKLALTGDLVGLEKLAVRLAERETSWGPFAQRLQQLAADMEDEQIITFIKQYMPKDT